MGDPKWSDDRFLDGLRRQGDSQADLAVRRLMEEREVRAVNELFKTLGADSTPIPADAPAPFREFVEATRGLPSWADRSRLARGGEVFLKHAFSSAVAMLASSLPRGYAAPCLCHILSISRDLQTHPYQRLMGVIQLLVNVSAKGSFEPDGRAVITAQKLRLLHAGVRTLVPRFRPGYEEKFGAPVNHEDMLATIMGFSYLVIDGLRRLGLPLSDAEAEDLYSLWRVYAAMMGIHPEGRPDDDSYIPATVEEAAQFYASFVRRQDTGPEKNPYGLVLTQDNLDMMRDLIPRPFRFVLGLAPRLAMSELMTPEEMARVGVRPVAGHGVLRAVFGLVLRLAQGIEDVVPFSTRLSTLLFQEMIDTSRDGVVEFCIPVNLMTLRSPGLE
ncbi:MAG: oxygenase MpaB family protein [Acidobacteriota bacterium]